MNTKEMIGKIAEMDFDLNEYVQLAVNDDNVRDEIVHQMLSNSAIMVYYHNINHWDYLQFGNFVQGATPICGEESYSTLRRTIGFKETISSSYATPEIIFKDETVEVTMLVLGEGAIGTLKYTFQKDFPHILLDQAIGVIEWAGRLGSGGLR